MIAKIIIFIKSIVIVRRIVYFVLRYMGVPFILRECIQRNCVTIALYHKIHANVFEQHIKALSKSYTFISLRQYVEAKDNNTVHLLPKKSLIITFDDGEKSNYTLLPIFKKYCVPVTIFLNSAIVGTYRHFWWNHTPSEEYNTDLKTLKTEEMYRLLKSYDYEEEKEYDHRDALSEDEVKEMSEVVDFQSHGRFHPMLPYCTKEKAYDEIEGSKKDLETRWGYSIYAYAFTNGDYSDRDIALLKKSGYKVGLTVDPYYNTSNTDAYRLKRLCVPGEADVNEAFVNISGFKIFLRNQLGELSYGYKKSI